ncbi:MAG: hypothetical protein RLY82_1679 [Pseudomonadota bacterium]
MKKLFIFLAIVSASQAFSQTATTSISFDGEYQRREWRTKERPLPDTDLSIKGTGGSFHQFVSKATRNNPCFGKVVPIEVSKIEGDNITFTVKLSSIMAQCADFTTTFRYTTANGKSGLALPNSDEVMFVKK